MQFHGRDSFLATRASRARNPPLANSMTTETRSQTMAVAAYPLAKCATHMATHMATHTQPRTSFGLEISCLSCSMLTAVGWGCGQSPTLRGCGAVGLFWRGDIVYIGNSIVKLGGKAGGEAERRTWGGDPWAVATQVRAHPLMR